MRDIANKQRSLTCRHGSSKIPKSQAKIYLSVQIFKNNLIERVAHHPLGAKNFGKILTSYSVTRTGTEPGIPFCSTICIGSRPFRLHFRAVRCLDLPDSTVLQPSITPSK